MLSFKPKERVAESSGVQDLQDRKTHRKYHMTQHVPENCFPCWKAASKVIWCSTDQHWVRSLLEVFKSEGKDLLGLKWLLIWPIHGRRGISFLECTGKWLMHTVWACQVVQVKWPWLQRCQWHKSSKRHGHVPKCNTAIHTSHITETHREPPHSACSHVWDSIQTDGSSSGFLQDPYTVQGNCTSMPLSSGNSLMLKEVRLPCKISLIQCTLKAFLQRGFSDDNAVWRW